MYELLKEALNDGIRRTVVITECNFAGMAIRRHTLMESWVSKFTAPDLDASSSEVAVEQMEIQYEDVRTEPLI
jgi:phage tail-like protein